MPQLAVSACVRNNYPKLSKSALKRAGLPLTIRFHDLRHSCATFLIAQGVHPRVVMEILGHSQISLTMNTYGHVQPETQRDATSKVAGMFGKREPKSESPPKASEATEQGETEGEQQSEEPPASGVGRDEAETAEAPPGQDDRPNLER